MASDGLRARLRTQMAALVAWITGEAVLGVALYPAAAAVVLVCMASAVLAITLRTSLRAGLIAGLAAAAPFTLVDIQPDSGPGVGMLQEAGALLLLGLGLIFASAPIGASISGTVSRLRAEPSPAPHDCPASNGGALVCERDTGGRLAGWELARAAEYEREVALALVGVDVRPGEGDVHAERALMRQLDDVILRCVTRFDVLSEYGRFERLLVLPEESAARRAGAAAEICTLATSRLGRPVRMALASFPAQGPTLRALLTDLEDDLAECRAGDVTVRISRGRAG